MGTNRHAADRVNKSGHTTPPPGQDRMTDQDHAMKARKQGASQRHSEAKPERRTREAGRDDHRTGSGH